MEVQAGFLKTQGPYLRWTSIWVSNQILSEHKVYFTGLGIEINGLAILRLGLVKFALRLQSQPQAVVGVGCFWIQPDDLPIFSGGIAELALALLHRAEIAVRTGELGIETDGLAILRLDLVSLPCDCKASPKPLWA